MIEIVRIMGIATCIVWLLVCPYLIYYKIKRYNQFKKELKALQDEFNKQVLKAELVTYDEKRLRVKSKPVLPGEDMTQLVEKLKKILQETRGIGISPVQVGIYKRLIVLRKQENEFMVLVNPRLKTQYDPAVVKREGCLSFPGERLTTMRYKYCSVFYHDLIKDSISGEEEREFTASDLPAVGLQHELDHLDGILFYDRIYTGIRSKKIERNALCPCKSGKKYKRCCGRNDANKN